MIFEALRRRVVRYFRPGATSVSPESPEFRSAVDLLVAQGMREIEQRTKPPRHPLAPEIDPPKIDWDIWTRMEREERRAGWAFCRYPVRASPPSNQIAFTFGIVRDAFGVHGLPFSICNHPGVTQAILFAITHLRSGFGCGIFTTQALACEAAEIAMRLSDGWADYEPETNATPDSRAKIARLHNAWIGAGITLASFHAHIVSEDKTPPMGVWIGADWSQERPPGSALS